MSKLILGFVGILGVFTAQAATPEGKRLSCIVGSSPIPITGFKPSSLGRIEMKVKNTQSGIVCYFCARKAVSESSQRSAFCMFSDESHWYFHYNGTIKTIADDSAKLDRQIVLSASAKDGIVVNGKSIQNSALDVQEFETGGDLILMAACNVSGSGYANQVNYTFYWTKVYDAEDKLVASFVPWLGKSEGGEDVAGVLDEQTGVFYQPDGATPLTYSELFARQLPWCESAKGIAAQLNNGIDTGFIPSSRGRIEARVAITEEGWGDQGYVQLPFCARKGIQEDRRAIGIALSRHLGVPTLAFHYGDTYTNFACADIMPFREMTISVSARDGVFVNGRMIAGSAIGAADFTVGGSLLIFGAVNAKFCNIRFYGLKVYDENEVLVKSYVPCMDEFETVGVCDEQTGVFFEPPKKCRLCAGRTLDVETIGWKTATVRLSAMPSDASVMMSDVCLWTVCDAEDKGEDLSRWTYKAGPFFVPADECAVDVAFPKEYKGNNRFGRVLLAAPPMLLATGEQYVDLERPLTSADGVEMVFAAENLSQKSSAFGARDGASSQSFSLQFGDGLMFVDFNNNDYEKTRAAFTVESLGEVYRVVDDFRHRVVTGLITNTQEANDEETADQFVQPANCRIFGMATGALTGYGNFQGGVCSFKVYETATGKVLYNLEPGFTAGGSACFVDTLTGKIYENQGTGSFGYSLASTSCSAALPPLKNKGLMVLLR